MFVRRAHRVGIVWIRLRQNSPRIQRHNIHPTQLLANHNYGRRRRRPPDPRHTKQIHQSLDIRADLLIQHRSPLQRLVVGFFAPEGRLVAGNQGKEVVHEFFGFFFAVPFYLGEFVLHVDEEEFAGRLHVGFVEAAQGFVGAAPFALFDEEAGRFCAWG
jgi:hypothetical protein